MINELMAVFTFMNSTKNITNAWLKRGAIASFVISAIFLLNTQVVFGYYYADDLSSAYAVSYAPDYDYTYDYGYANDYSYSYAPDYSYSYASDYTVPTYAAAYSSTCGSSAASGVDVYGSAFDFGFSYAQSSAPCSSTYYPPTPPTPPALNGSCSANTSNPKIGDTVTWSASGVTGGNGNYSYSWSGTDGLSGNSFNTSKSYSSSGTKMATVRISSGSQSITRNCNTSVAAPVVQTVTASCSVNTSSTQVGNSVTFNASASGGNGSYSYSWSGPENLSGSASSITKTFSYTGSKTATVNVTSGGSSASASCSVNIVDVPVQPVALNGSCSANTSNPSVGDTVTWSAHASGGNGNYSYSWSGDESLYGSGQSVSRSYSWNGTKTATVTIYSNGQSITRNCSTLVSQQYYPPQNNSLNAYCVANQNSSSVGDSVTWSASGVTGGNGNYSYSWSGTDGLYGNNYSAYQTYNYAGTKYAYLTVYSNGQSITRTCSTYVNQRYVTPPTYYPPQPPVYQPTYTGGVTLSQVPYTGIDSNMKVILFTLALIAWSAIVTYIVIIRKRGNLTPAMAVASVDESVTVSDDAQQIARQEELMGYDNMINSLESFARNQNVIISADALAAVVDLAGNDEKRAETLISSLANRHSNGEDWTTLDLSKVKSALV